MLCELCLLGLVLAPGAWRAASADVRAVAGLARGLPCAAQAPAASGAGAMGSPLVSAGIGPGALSGGSWRGVLGAQVGRGVVIMCSVRGSLPARAHGAQELPV